MRSVVILWLFLFRPCNHAIAETKPRVYVQTYSHDVDAADNDGDVIYVDDCY
jgi:hypothetical protein